MIDKLLQQIIEQGLLGVLLVLSLIANYFFYSEIKKKDECIKEILEQRAIELKEIIGKGTELSTGIKLMLENILSLLQVPRRRA